MTIRIKLVLALILLALLLALGLTQSRVQQAMAAEGMGMSAPSFEVDPFWPKPLPNHWILGNTIGVAVDSRDHVYIVHRTEDEIFGDFREIGLKTGDSECCTPAPPILEFDPEGNLINAWGGPGEGYTWPSSNHGIEIAPNGDVWIGGNGGSDSHMLVFSRGGEFLREIGIPGYAQPDSNSTERFSRVAEIAIDEANNEAYIADGYGNKRVVVLDATTGEFKRYWGAYGNRPQDIAISYDPDAPLPTQFIGPVHCAEPSNDGLVYVCDRAADRVQVFRTDGTFVSEHQYFPQTLRQGSTWDIAFSQDPEQSYIYLADGQNMKVTVIERESMEVVYTFGDGGRQPGQFYAVHSVVTDSQGNLYTTETYEGKRLQKFVYQGMAPVTAPVQGVAWPDDEL